jgi:hypothetical protein
VALFGVLVWMLTRFRSVALEAWLGVLGAIAFFLYFAWGIRFLQLEIDFEQQLLRIEFPRGLVRFKTHLSEIEAVSVSSANPLLPSSIFPGQIARFANTDGKSLVLHLRGRRVVTVTLPDPNAAREVLQNPRV